MSAGAWILLVLVAAFAVRWILRRGDAELEQLTKTIERLPRL